MPDRQGSHHVRALDGIRGLAIILVCIYHAFLFSPAYTPFAALLHEISARCWVGVDLFFVLSGYLITGVLLRAKNADNYYQVFYARRALRILPLYYVAMFGWMLVAHDWPPVKYQAWFWFNLSNLPTAFTPYLIPYLAHYWSLAIEEQFYLLWPAVVRKVSETVLIRVCIGALIGCFVLRNLPIVLAWNQRWPNFIYRLTPFRIDTLCAGALLAILTYGGVNMTRYRWHLRIGCIAGAAIFVISTLFDANSNLPARFAYTGAVICFTALIALALDPDKPTAKIFANGFLRRMGLYSYCFYLIHTGVLSQYWLVHHRLSRVHLTFASEYLNQLLINSFLFAVTFGICAASYRFFESPILGLKRFFPYRGWGYPEVLPATVSAD
jgi:peptidoglycan/LPS O-acetylase OafA/YrhL